MIGSVEDEILAHDGQTDEAKISSGLCLRRCTDIDAGEPRTRVSITSMSGWCVMRRVLREGRLEKSAWICGRGDGWRI